MRYDNQPVIVGTILAVTFLGFAWGFTPWPVWALAPVLGAVAGWISWRITAKSNHNRPALIGAFIVFLLLFCVCAIFPAAMIGGVMQRNCPDGACWK